jgi:hypothetical protein
MRLRPASQKVDFVIPASEVLLKNSIVEVRQDVTVYNDEPNVEVT